MFRARLAVIVGTVAVAMLLVAPAMACTTPNWVTPAGDPAADPPEPGSDFPIDAGGYEPGVVDLRLDGLDGESLGTAQAGEDGRFSATVELPADLEPGAHQIVATQIAADGSRLWGFAPITVVEAPGGTSIGVFAGFGAALALLVSVGVVVLRHLRGQRARDLEAMEIEFVDEDFAELLDEDAFAELLDDEAPVPTP